MLVRWQAMGLFYMLSGFVMWLGYAQATLADPVDAVLCRFCCCGTLFLLSMLGLRVWSLEFISEWYERSSGML